MCMVILMVLVLNYRLELHGLDGRHRSLRDGETSEEMTPIWACGDRTSTSIDNLENKAKRTKQTHDARKFE